MNNNKKIRIGLFGGSFNPPHNGHIAICKWLLSGNGLVDLVWVIPCFKHPFGKSLASFEDRYKMCLFAFREFGAKVVVSRVEEVLGEISHTIKTIKYLKNDYPDYGFSLVTGEDVKGETKTWLNFEEIKSLVPIITIPRGASSPILDISSTKIREYILQGQGIVQYVPKEVGVYIITHGLYRE